jgi:4-diphosphocytidyl-2-C-methyl-D-erythritol kinase
MDYERLAPAKVNLFLHVGPVGADGYHAICSLVTFADVGDIVRLRRSPEMGFSIEGPFAAELKGQGDNLVTRARDLALSRWPSAPPTFHLTLDKRLPVAAGLGGGSSDGAATLLLIDEILGGGLARRRGRLARLAAELGADGPMCLAGVAAVATGRGDVLSFPPAFPDVEAVLVNPMVASPTGAVYRAFDAAGAPGGAGEPAWAHPLESSEALARFLRSCRNDLEAPAIALQPAIAAVLAALRARPETLIARMSGSGATCFALCAGARERDRLARSLAVEHRDWWVKPCRLAGVRP